MFDVPRGSRLRAAWMSLISCVSGGTRPQQHQLESLAGQQELVGPGGRPAETARGLVISRNQPWLGNTRDGCRRYNHSRWCGGDVGVAAVAFAQLCRGSLQAAVPHLPFLQF